MKEKEVAKMKLTLTTNCNSNCNYCFVDKTNQRMTFEVAKKSVDLLVESPGEDKLLSLYGGEPFLEFPLIEQIVIHARKREKTFKKRLIISICSNLLLLDERKLNFLKKYGLKVTVSIVGERDVHDKFRAATGRESAYDRVVANLKLLASELPSADIGISFVVLPELSRRMEEYFFHILSLGISNNINFEIIQEFEKWRKVDRKNFVSGFHRILLRVMKLISENDFIFINPVSWELGRRKLTDSYGVPCQIRYNIEVYPSGDMAFSPFLLNGDENSRNQFLIGNIKQGLNEKFKNCVFDGASDECRECESKYYDSYLRSDDAHFVVEAYGKMSLEAAKQIEKMAETNKCFRAYVSYAKKNLCF